jgi:hypothetical protein
VAVVTADARHEVGDRFPFDGEQFFAAAKAIIAGLQGAALRCDSAERQGRLLRVSITMMGQTFARLPTDLRAGSGRKFESVFMLHQRAHTMEVSAQ